MNDQANEPEQDVCPDTGTDGGRAFATHFYEEGQAGAFVPAPESYLMPNKEFYHDSGPPFGPLSEEDKAYAETLDLTGVVELLGD